MAILGIRSGCRSARNLQRITKLVFRSALGLELPKALCELPRTPCLADWQREKIRYNLS